MSFLKRMRGPVLLVAGAAAIFTAISAARADTYPSRPVRVIIPTTAGGGSDIMARAIGAKLGEIWGGQQVVIDNRPGGGVLIGTEIAAKAPPDGYTLLFSYTDHIYYPSMHQRMPYDAIKDFAPITTVATVPLYVVVHPSLGVNSISELVAKLEASPGKYNFGSAGLGSSLHLAGELFKSLARVEVEHVPYKGSSPAFADLVAGRIQMMFPTTLSIRPYLEAGSVKALAITTASRVQALANMPTVAESGLPGYEAAIWYGVMAPAGTPKEIVAKLNRDFVKAIEAPEVREKLAAQGAVVHTSTPEAFGELMRNDLQKWAKIIKDAKITLD